MQQFTAETNNYLDCPVPQQDDNQCFDISISSTEISHLYPQAMSEPERKARLVHVAKNFLGRCFYDSERVGGFSEGGVSYGDHNLAHHTIKKIKTLQDFETLSDEDKQLYQDMKVDPATSKSEFDEYFAALFGLYDGRFGKKVALYLRDKGYDEIIQIVQHFKRHELLGVLRPTVPQDLHVETNPNLLQVFTTFDRLKRSVTENDLEVVGHDDTLAQTGRQYIDTVLNSLDDATRKKAVDYFPTNEAELISIYGELAGGLFTPAFGARRNEMNQGLNPTEWDNADKLVINIGLAGIVHALYGEKMRHASRFQRLGIGLLMVSGELSGGARYNDQEWQSRGPRLKNTGRFKSAIIESAWRVSTLRS